MSCGCQSPYRTIWHCVWNPLLAPAGTRPGEVTVSPTAIGRCVFLIKPQSVPRSSGTAVARASLAVAAGSTGGPEEVGPTAGIRKQQVKEVQYVEHFVATL